MREEGEGIPRMFEEMQESLLREPRLAVDGGEFCVTLLNEPVFSGGDPEWRRIVGRLPLTAAQRRVLVAKPEGFTNEDYRRLNKVDRDRAYQGIQEMVESGVIRSADSKGRGAVYHLTPDLHATRAFLSGKASKIPGFIARNGVLRNSDYRNLFGTTRHAALRDLRVLVEHGYLISAGERRGAHFVAGVALEAAAKK